MLAVSSVRISFREMPQGRPDGWRAAQLSLPETVDAVRDLRPPLLSCAEGWRPMAGCPRASLIYTGGAIRRTTWTKILPISIAMRLSARSNAFAPGSEHRDSFGHELCWHHPKLWGLLPEKHGPQPSVPAWPQFLRGCIQYRESLDRQLPTMPPTNDEFPGRR